MARRSNKKWVPIIGIAKAAIALADKQTLAGAVLISGLQRDELDRLLPTELFQKTVQIAIELKMRDSQLPDPEDVLDVLDPDWREQLPEWAHKTDGRKKAIKPAKPTNVLQLVIPRDQDPPTPPVQEEEHVPPAARVESALAYVELEKQGQQLLFSGILRCLKTFAGANDDDIKAITDELQALGVQPDAPMMEQILAGVWNPRRAKDAMQAMALALASTEQLLNLPALIKEQTLVAEGLLDPTTDAGEEKLVEMLAGFPPHLLNLAMQRRKTG